MRKFIEEIQTVLAYKDSNPFKLWWMRNITNKAKTSRQHAFRWLIYELFFEWKRDKFMRISHHLILSIYKNGYPKWVYFMMSPWWNTKVLFRRWYAKLIKHE